MLCRNCYKMVPDGAKFCPECGAVLEQTADDQDIGVGYDSFESGDATKMSNNKQNVSSSARTSKQSKLGIVAAILSLLFCTSGIGLILGLIDIIKNKNDGNKHGASKFAVIWGAGMSLILLFFVFIASWGSNYQKTENTDASRVAEEVTVMENIADDEDIQYASEDLEAKDNAEASDAEVEVPGDSTEEKEAEIEEGNAAAKERDFIQDIDAALASDSTNPNSVFKVSECPEYKGEPYVEVNGNHPFFENEIKEAVKQQQIVGDQGLQYYSELDALGRCGLAYEIVSKGILPTEERGQIGDIQPSGWQTIKYPELIEDLFLYNRCHLIGYQLGGGNGDEKNLITGTRYLNMQGMLPFENSVTKYVEDTDNHVVYRVSPVFEKDNLVASGVLMEAYSIEDEGAGVDFCIYAYNVQPGIVIDYTNGESYAENNKNPEEEQQNELASTDDSKVIPITEIGDNTDNTSSTASRSTADGSDKSSVSKSNATADTTTTGKTTSGTTYVLNKNTKKFHYPNCKSVSQMKEKNKEYSSQSRDEIIARGYEPCKNCNP